MKQDYIELVSDLQQAIGVLPNKYIYNIWSRTIPKRKTYFRYIKGKRSLTNDKLLVILANHWRVSKREIKDNYHLISKDYIEHLLYELGIDGRKHKTYLK